MSKEKLIQEFEEVLINPKTEKCKKYYTGVDLGTAFIVMVVMNEDGVPIAGDYQYATVVKDGMVVDYIGALRIVRDMKEKLEGILGTELVYAAAAIPPGTENIDHGVVKNVVEGAGFEVISISEESTAANEVLEIENGAVVDIGGGTTGITIFKNSEAIASFDEATGGTHFSLVISGAYKISFDEAELKKRDASNHKELFTTVRPVIQKIASIISDTISDYDVDCVHLVGGTCCFTGIEDEIEKQIKIPTSKPKNPMFATPLGIALSCVKAGEGL